MIAPREKQRMKSARPVGRPPVRTLLPPLLREFRHLGVWIRALPLIGLYWLGAWLLTRVPTSSGPPLPWPYALYHSLRFFTLDARGFPTGPHRGLNGLFWFVLFGAPAI